MLNVTRGLSLLCLISLAASGCGGSSESPTAPSSSGSGSATIAGMVSRTAGAPLGLTVAVTGTNLSAPVESSGRFQLDRVPGGDVQLKFKDSTVDANAKVTNVGQGEFIEIQVQVSATQATIVSETRSAGKIALCHRTESGTYNLIDISVNAESAHRDHGDAKIGEPVPGTQRQVFDSACRPSGPAVKIEKSTNGEDADQAPGPTITVGSAVTWRYLVTNTGTISLTGIAVSDDRGVAVNCGGQASLNAGQAMTCTGSGVATLGQYRNIGTVTAGSASGAVNDSNPSHYLGVAPTTETEGQKIQICHRTGSGRFNLLEISVNAEPAHRAHGDGKIGEPVPDSPGKVFGAGCSVQ
jgi:hypothetical protein